MAKLYGSEEIYKVTRINNEKTAVPLQGLYVAGKRLDPTYENHCASLVGITVSTTATREYQDVSADLSGDGSFGIINIDIDNVFTLQPYSTARDQVSTEGSFGILDISLTDDYNLYEYTRSYVDEHVNDGGFGILDITLSDSFSFTTITRTNHTNSEPMTRVVSISVSPMTYTD